MSAEEPRRRKLTITHPARDDLRDIHAYTVERHGTRGSEAYDGLLKQAIRDVWEDPHRPGSRDRPEIGDGIRSYHTRLSRNRAGGEIRAPRHFVLYFTSHRGRSCRQPRPARLPRPRSPRPRRPPRPGSLKSKLIGTWRKGMPPAEPRRLRRFRDDTGLRDASQKMGIIYGSTQITLDRRRHTPFNGA